MRTKQKIAAGIITSALVGLVSMIMANCAGTTTTLKGKQGDTEVEITVHRPLQCPAGCKVPEHKHDQKDKKSKKEKK